MRIFGIIAGLLIMSLAGSCKNKEVDSLNFDIEKYTIQTLEYNSRTFNVRAYEGIVYVADPVDSVYQSMNIYIPEEYFNGGSVNGYTAETAPIFFPNQIGGYMPATPASTTGRSVAGMPQMLPPDGVANVNEAAERVDRRVPDGGRQRVNTVVAALSRGYIVASPGARGRVNQDSEGIFYGKAPAGIVDLKAAVRYLKHNDKTMPGDANKIITNGTSAGGAMSSLLGVTGDHHDYLPYLKEIGAADASDAVFATSAYCPITNLDHADMAYEWQYNGVNTYTSRARVNQSGHPASNALSKEQILISDELKSLFPEYVNDLELIDEDGNRLRLDAYGNGSFKDFVIAVVIASANKAVGEGKDLSAHKWLTFRNGMVADLDWDGYVNYMTRQKTPPAFDALDLSSPENSLFGNAKIDSRHFTRYGEEHSQKSGVVATMDVIRMMNPMHYIDDPRASTAEHWRIRHGAKDSDGGLAVSAMLTTLLRNNGRHVDYALPWDVGHSGDYDLEELFEWIDSICR